MPGCGCTGAGTGVGCSFSNTGNVTFGGSCAAGITGDVAPADILNDLPTAVVDMCGPFQIPVKSGGTWKLVSLSSLRCAQIV